MFAFNTISTVSHNPWKLETAMTLQLLWPFQNTLTNKNKWCNKYNKPLGKLTIKDTGVHTNICGSAPPGTHSFWRLNRILHFNKPTVTNRPQCCESFVVKPQPFIVPSGRSELSSTSVRCATLSITKGKKKHVPANNTIKNKYITQWLA